MPAPTRWLRCFAMAFACLVTPALQAGPPNIIVILMDDMGYGDLSSTGNRNVETPNIDRIANEGVRLDSFYVCPLCAPTRAEFLTGRYHTRGGVHGVTVGEERLNPEDETIAEVFKQAGYRTGLFGKWHNGTQYPYHPNGQGFDEFYGFTSGHWGQYFSPPLEHNTDLIRGEGHVTTDFTTKMLAFAEDSVSQQKPFFAYLAYCVPHTPMQVDRALYDSMPKELASLYEGSEKEDIDLSRAALAMVKDADNQIARVFEMLASKHLDENTIVVFFSDNGPNSWRFNAKMKGRKGSTSEGGVRVPCYVRWPGRIPAGQSVDQLSGAIDLLPTLKALCGIEAAPAQPLDGIDISVLLTHTSSTPVDRRLYTAHKRVSVRNQSYILDEKGDLYDRINDKLQIRKLNDQQPEIRASMMKGLVEWKSETGFPLPKESRPFPVGYPEYPVTHLPARDATLSGDVKRSSRHPNCSYITEWKSNDATVSYPLDVQTAGVYDVILHYCCPAENIGTAITIKAGDDSFTATIDEPHDSLLIGEHDDVVPRPGESYMKVFKPWLSGKVNLEKGPATLTLQPAKILGQQSIELYWVELRLQK